MLKWHEFRANRTRYIHRLHLKYGPAVRIAPDEVSFASATAVKEIYCSGGSGFVSCALALCLFVGYLLRPTIVLTSVKDKTDFYDLFRVYGRRTMFTTLNKDDVRPSLDWSITALCS